MSTLQFIGLYNRRCATIDIDCCTRDITCPFQGQKRDQTAGLTGFPDAAKRHTFAHVVVPTTLGQRGILR